MGKALSELDPSVFLLQAQAARHRAAETTDPSIRAEWIAVAGYWRQLAEDVEGERLTGNIFSPC